jgi:opacity protein-like surface antigen
MSYHVRLTSLLLTLLALLCLSASQAGIVYVKYDSPNDGPGNDWDHAFHTVQAGIDASVASDEVRVAQGTYVQCITLKAETALKGGYLGTGDTRDVAL